MASAIDKASDTFLKKEAKLFSWEVNSNEIKLNKLVGAGAYGEVYHGEWGGLDVAVKILIKKGDIPDSELESFSQEIKLMRYILQFLLYAHIKYIYMYVSL